MSESGVKVITVNMSNSGVMVIIVNKPFMMTCSIHSDVHNTYIPYKMNSGRLSQFTVMYIYLWHTEWRVDNSIDNDERVLIPYKMKSGRLTQFTVMCLALNICHTTWRVDDWPNSKLCSLLIPTTYKLKSGWFTQFTDMYTYLWHTKWRVDDLPNSQLCA